MSESFYQKSSIKQLGRLKNASPNAHETVDSINAFFEKAMMQGVLTSKTKELIAIAVAHATACPYCIDYHVKAAKRAGATEAEMTESILVAIALRAGGAFMHAGIAYDSFDEPS